MTVLFLPGECRILLVGTGGLAVWAMRIARYYWPQDRQKTHIVVACLRDEGISIVKGELKYGSLSLFIFLSILDDFPSF